MWCPIVLIHILVNALKKSKQKTQQLGPSFQKRRAWWPHFFHLHKERHQVQPQTMASWQFDLETLRLVVLKLEWTSESGQLIKTQIPGSHPQKCCFSRPGWGYEFAFPICSQIMLMILALRPHVEDKWAPHPALLLTEYWPSKCEARRLIWSSSMVMNMLIIS